MASNNKHLSSQFLQVRDLGTQTCSLTQSSREIAVKVLAGCYSHLKAQLVENPFPSLFMWLFADLRPLLATKVLALVPCHRRDALVPDFYHDFSFGNWMIRFIF